MFGFGPGPEMLADIGTKALAFARLAAAALFAIFPTSLEKAAVNRSAPDKTHKSLISPFSFLLSSQASW